MNYKDIKPPEITVRFKAGRKSNFKLTTSRDVASLLRTLFDADLIGWREECILLCLNRSSNVLGYFRLSTGGVAGTVIDTKIIYTIALKTGASSIILSHNHPSGNAMPSDSDLQITRKIHQAGLLLDIRLLDHVIILPEIGDRLGYYSMLDNGHI